MESRGVGQGNSCGCPARFGEGRRIRRTAPGDTLIQARLAGVVAGSAQVTFGTFFVKMKLEALCPPLDYRHLHFFAMRVQNMNKWECSRAQFCEIPARSHLI